jgi:hypothetical protein
MNEEALKQETARRQVPLQDPKQALIEKGFFL